MLLQQEFAVSPQNGVFIVQTPDPNSEITISHANILELRDIHGTEQNLAITAPTALQEHLWKKGYHCEKERQLTGTVRKKAVNK